MSLELCKQHQMQNSFVKSLGDALNGSGTVAKLKKLRKLNKTLVFFLILTINLKNI
jgi:hypothetical protein